MHSDYGFAIRDARKAGLRVSKILHRDERNAKIDMFVHTNGVTRCPTACVAETQGEPDSCDRAALEEHAGLKDAERRRRIARNRSRTIAAFGRLPYPEE